ncbi:MAG TPA: DUF1592 domain-containing protein [Polyangiaceae bacterium]|nr:DUF1592 domain-containing protein [Polyangiaceae bacterium]
MSSTKALVYLALLPVIGACTAVVEGDGKGTETEPVPPVQMPGQTPNGITCNGSEVLIPKRLVRLTFNQQVNALSSLFGAPLGETISGDFEIGAANQRTFPPLANPREGTVITGSQWQVGDNIAQTVGKYVHDNFAAVTSCSDSPTPECAQGFLTGLAQRAYRRPLSEAETGRLLGVYSAVTADGGTVQEGVQYGVYAVLESPWFLYRTEFGAGGAVEGPLLGHEQANLISFFLTDAPPDQALLDAGANGGLSTAEGIKAEVTRLLATDAAKLNLQSAMFAYFQLAGLGSVVIDPAKTPEFDDTLRYSMMREAELFINGALWNGPLADMLTSRRSTINASLATIYGIAFPPPGAVVDAEGYAPVELPENRGGLLMMPGFLTTKSRPDHASVVGRGLAVNAALLCAQNPIFPENLADAIAAVNAMQAGLSEREKANARATTNPCAGCHTSFDPYGIALENYDIIGRFRTMDPEGRPIDASVTLPPNAGGQSVPNAVEMAKTLAAGDAFATCMTKNLISFALAEGGGDIESCATKTVAENFAATDRTFSDLVKVIAASNVFQLRTAGGTAP